MDGWELARVMCWDLNGQAGSASHRETQAGLGTQAAGLPTRKSLQYENFLGPDGKALATCGIKKVSV